MKAISFKEFTGCRTATIGKDMFCSDSKRRLKGKKFRERICDSKGRGRKKSLLAALSYYTSTSHFFLEIINKPCIFNILKYFSLINKVCQSFIFFYLFFLIP
jgi:hypothetical protein